MQEKKITLEEIGEVILRKYKQSKRIRIKLFETHVLVTLPYVCKFSEALKFVEQKNDWILHYKNKAKKQSQLFDFSTNFSTKFRKLQIKARPDSEKIVSHIGTDSITILIPQTSDIYSDETQTYIKNTIEKAYRLEALEYLPKRLEELAKLHHFSFKSIRINAAKTRWGSCNSQNRINLSLYNMQLPDHLIDYIILHELAHTIHKNHSADFYNFLDKITLGNSDKHNHELKKYRPGNFLCHKTK